MIKTRQRRLVRYPSDMSTIGGRVKAMRESRRMSGAALARKLGIKQPSLWKLENDPDAEPSGRLLTSLCAVFNTTPEYIMDGANSPDDLEMQMHLAEIVFSFRHLDEIGRNALVATARGLMAPSVSKSNPFPDAKKDAKPKKHPQALG